MTNITHADSRAKSVIISANPKSGSADGKAVIGKLESKLRSRGFDVTVMLDIEQVCREASRQLQEGKLRTVVSAGGDGTATLLVNRLPAEVPIAILPLGTANLLAKHLRLNPDADQLADVIEHGKSVLMDVGRANGYLFLVVASCGFDAAVVQRLHKHRTGHISYWTYSLPILRSIWRYKYPKMRFVADGKRLPDASWAFVLNVPRYAMNLCFVEQADAQDGMLDMCTFKNGGLVRGLYYFFAVLFRQHRKLNSTNFVRFKHLTIESDSMVPYEIDGDPGGELPLTIEIVPQRMKMMVSESWLSSPSGA